MFFRAVLAVYFAFLGCFVGLSSLFASPGEVLGWVEVPEYEYIFTVNIETSTADHVLGDGSCADREGNCSFLAALMEAKRLSDLYATAPLILIELDVDRIMWDPSALFPLGRLFFGEVKLAIQGQLNSDGTNRTTVFFPEKTSFFVADRSLIAIDQLNFVVDATAVDHDSDFEWMSLIDARDTTLVLRSLDAVKSASSHGIRFLNADGSFLAVSQSYFEGFGLKNNLTDRVFYGGAFSFSSSFVFIDSTTIEQSLAYRGGAIYAFLSHLEITSSNFEHNQATALGGGITLKRSRLYALQTQFLDNQVLCDEAAIERGAICDVELKKGGALYGDESFAKLTRSSFIHNESQEFGGAIYFGPISLLLLDQANFTTNRAQKTGGAIHIFDAQLGALQTRFEQNQAVGEIGQGGALALQKAQLNLDEEVVFFQNTATLKGGAIFSQDSVLEISQTSFLANRAQKWGGGLYYNHQLCDDQPSFLKVSHSQFEGNEAGFQGAGAFLRTQQVLCSADLAEFPALEQLRESQRENAFFERVDFRNNQLNDLDPEDDRPLAYAQGAGLYAEKIVLELNRSYFLANAIEPLPQETVSVSSGGGLYYQGPQVRVFSSAILNNVAAKGAGIFLDLSYLEGLDPQSLAGDLSGQNDLNWQTETDLAISPHRGVMIENSTIAANLRGGGLYIENTRPIIPVLLFFSTVIQNEMVQQTTEPIAGGYYNNDRDFALITEGVLLYGNRCVNSERTETNSCDCFGRIESSGRNLFADESSRCPTYPLAGGVYEDLVLDADEFRLTDILHPHPVYVDANLPPLYLLKSDSPAVNVSLATGYSRCRTRRFLDQRGQWRDAYCDIGAVEYSPSDFIIWSEYDAHAVELVY